MEIVSVERIEGVEFRQTSPAHSYERRPATLVNAERTTNAIRNQYASSRSDVPADGVYILKNAEILERGAVKVNGFLLEESLEYGKANDIGRLGVTSDVTFDECIHINKAGSANYGHFLVEMLPRLLINQYSLPESVPVTVHRNACSFALRLFERARVKNSVIRANNMGLYARRLIWPARNSFHPFSKSRNIVPALRSMINRGAEPKRCLFVSRRDATTRKLLNDQEIFSQLEPLGFEWVEPGRMTVDDQIDTFAEARMVIGVSGAALTNMVFMPPNGKVVMLAPQTAGGAFFWDIAHHARLGFTVIFGQNQDPSIGHKNADFTIDAEQVMAAIAA